MNTLKIIICFVTLTSLIICSPGLFSQTKNDMSKGRKYIVKNTGVNDYIAPVDPKVNAKLEKWKGYKLGVLITWGVYTQWGIIDSWTLCSYDAGWNHRSGPYADDYDTYKKQYEKIYTYFNPVNFNPDLWVTAFKNAGVKYVLAMTKHLDGFCMYDTQTTDYRITSPNCPFHTNSRANISYEILQSARNQGLSVGAYFSKPDWNVNSFWWRYFGVIWLDVNYNTTQYSERWNSFKSFVYNQIDEVTKNLGSLDILWMDGSWVRPNSSMDINMPSIVSNVRNNQPGIIVVDRGCGQFEDYLTPEYEIPPDPLGVPFEVVRAIGPFWGHVPGMYYYHPDTLVHTLIEVVAKGGNLLYGLGPDEFGQLDTACYDRLQRLGNWINVNSEAIYETTNINPYRYQNVFFTSKKDTVFAIYIAYDNQQTLPSQINWGAIRPKNGTNVYLLGYNQPLSWSTSSSGITTVNIPPHLQQNPPCLHAWSFKFTKARIR